MVKDCALSNVFLPVFDPLGSANINRTGANALFQTLP
jgi:hypothetical protein